MITEQQSIAAIHSLISIALLLAVGTVVAPSEVAIHTLPHQERISMSLRSEDERTFGVDAWVYCAQHLRAHKTGWCTVSNRDKTKLEATTEKDAAEECRRRGFKLFSDIKQ